MLIEGARLKGASIGKYKGVKQIGFLHSLTSQKLESYKKELERKNYKIDKLTKSDRQYFTKNKLKPKKARSKKTKKKA